MCWPHPRGCSPSNEGQCSRPLAMCADKCPSPPSLAGTAPLHCPANHLAGPWASGSPHHCWTCSTGLSETPAESSLARPPCPQYLTTLHVWPGPHPTVPQVTRRPSPAFSSVCRESQLLGGRSSRGLVVLDLSSVSPPCCKPRCSGPVTGV